MLSTRVIDYDVSHRHRAIAHGGIGAIHMLAHQLGLPQAIDGRLHLLKVHLPYHESDHVLNIAYNALCHGTCLQDIDLRRNDEAFLDALGARRIPDPTTAGDFCRRFTAADLDTLQDAIDGARRNVWAEQPASFFGFRRIVLRGDTDFSQTEHLDRWHALPWVRFVFGYDARSNLEAIAQDLPAAAWQPLRRPARYDVKTQPRTRPEGVKDRIVRERGFAVLKLQSEEVAEFEYRPTACINTFRMVVIRKHISREKGEQVLFPEVRYFFYLTNDRDLTTAEVVFEANARCDQENLLAQLHGGTHALAAPVDALVSNGAWMMMTALAWTLKAWWALLLPESPGRWQEQHRQEKTRVLRMEFKTFVNAFVTIPCQVLQTGRRVVLRLLGWNPHLLTFFRLVTRLRR